MYVLAFEEHPQFLLARATGERTAQNLLRSLQESLAACLAGGRSKLLLEMHLGGPGLSSAAIVNVISLVMPEALKLAKIALVEAVNGDSGLPFAETVALNRGVNLRLFHTGGEAAQWLSGV